MMPQDRNEYIKQYIKDNLRQVMLKLSRKHEADMIEWLESQDSMQTYLKQLIREDMERKGVK